MHVFIITNAPFSYHVDSSKHGESAHSEEYIRVVENIPFHNEYYNSMETEWEHYVNRYLLYDKYQECMDNKYSIDDSILDDAEYKVYTRDPFRKD